MSTRIDRGYVYRRAGFGGHSDQPPHSRLIKARFTPIQFRFGTDPDGVPSSAPNRTTRRVCLHPD
jgi:hypothetical protein